MNSVSEPPSATAFGRFLLSPQRRELLANGRPLKLGGRAFDVLLALLEARGAVVSKDALMARVWPDRIVEENALQSQISALRAALGADRELIRTVSGRGYQFTGGIRVLPAISDERAGAGMAMTERKATPPPTNLPQPVSELIGRDEELAEVLNLVAAHRLVTLTGAGGIGKTRLALALGRELLSHFSDGAWVAELASLSDPDLVPVTVAAALGLEFTAGTVSPLAVANALRSKQLVLVLDNCEHVIDAAASMAEALLRASLAVRVIATSREPLRAEGEWLYPVPPLAVPTEGGPDGEDPLRYGAVRLFVERARAGAPHFSPGARAAAAIGRICRRLDGIPLAIELAVARVATLGVEGLAAGLDDRFRLLAGGRRTALPRHQTLRATLDWSYELLTEAEREILRRLAVFAGAFSLEAADAVVASLQIASSDVLNGLSDLVAKSLVATEVDGTIARYRLLDTTRGYALEKLGESGELEAAARRHAEYYRGVFARAEAEWETRPMAEWLADYGSKIDNLRSALDWAFSPGGDPPIGVALTAAAVPLWMHLSLMEECRSRVERALSAVERGASPDARREMQLQIALGTTLVNTTAVTSPEVGGAWTKALELAESLDDAEYQLRSLRGLWTFNLNGGRHRVALALAQRFCTLAADRTDPNDRLLGERMIGVAQFYLGDQENARRHIERVLAGSGTPDAGSHIIRFQLDLRVAARTFLAWILWLQGFPDRAMRAAESTFEDARATDHALSICYALARATFPIALLVGDLAAAEHYVRVLIDYSTRHALGHWQAIGRCHQGALAIKRSDVVTGLRLLRAGLGELGEARSPVLRLIGFLMGEALSRAGQIVDGLAAVEEALAWTERSEERWAIAELLRSKGELLLLQGAPGAVAVAGEHFGEALEWARRQGALAWELRAGTSLARLLCDQGRSADAKALLQPVYDRFTEGFDTADLKAAKALLGALV